LPSDDVIDLDKYRAERIADGSWPPDPLQVREYWKGRRRRGAKPVYDKPKGGGAA